MRGTKQKLGLLELGEYKHCLKSKVKRGAKRGVILVRIGKLAQDVHYVLCVLVCK